MSGPVGVVWFVGVAWCEATVSGLVGVACFVGVAWCAVTVSGPVGVVWFVGVTVTVSGPVGVVSSSTAHLRHQTTWTICSGPSRRCSMTRPSACPWQAERMHGEVRKGRAG